MTGKVIEFPRAETADEVMAKAAGKFDTIFIVGWSEDGNLLSATNMEHGEAIALLEVGKAALVNDLFE